MECHKEPLIDILRLTVLYCGSLEYHKALINILRNAAFVSL